MGTTPPVGDPLRATPAGSASSATMPPALCATATTRSDSCGSLAGRDRDGVVVGKHDITFKLLPFIRERVTPPRLRRALPVRVPSAPPRRSSPEGSRHRGPRRPRRHGRSKPGKRRELVRASLPRAIAPRSKDAGLRISAVSGEIGRDGEVAAPSADRQRPAVGEVYDAASPIDIKIRATGPDQGIGVSRRQPAQGRLLATRCREQEGRDRLPRRSRPTNRQ